MQIERRLSMCLPTLDMRIEANAPGRDPSEGRSFHLCLYGRNYSSVYSLRREKKFQVKLSRVSAKSRDFDKPRARVRNCGNCAANFLVWKIEEFYLAAPNFRFAIGGPIFFLTSR